MGGAELSPAERALAEHLGEVWNGFLRLPVMHADDLAECRSLIHALQDKVLSRPARRALAEPRPPRFDPPPPPRLKPFPALPGDHRPANCTMRLREDGKASPKSGCMVMTCGDGGMHGCPYELKAAT